VFQVFQRRQMNGSLQRQVLAMRILKKAIDILIGGVK
jgi:hypothetical protein